MANEKHGIISDLKNLATPIGLFKALPGNPRRGNVQAVVKSYEKFGQRKPIVARRETDGTLIVISGNHQLLAAISLGWTHIAASIVDEDVTVSEAFALADNRTADLGTYDDKALAEMLERVAVDDSMLDATGYDLADLEKLLGIEPELPSEGQIMDAPTDPVTMVGDAWRLGDHYVVCGSATEPSSYYGIQGQAALCLTDPPYNVDYKDTHGRSIENDKMAEDSFTSFLYDALSMIHAFTDGAVYMFYATAATSSVFQAWSAAKMHYSSNIIWVKDSFVLGRSDFHWRFEPIMYGWPEGKSHYFIGRRDLSNVWDDFKNNKIGEAQLDLFDNGFNLTVELDNEDDELLRELKKTKNSELNLGLFGSSNEEMYDDSRTFKVNEMVFGPSNVWNVPKPRNNKDHPTMKPLELLSKAILYSSKPGDLVLDPFAGSGSTLIAAHALNRKCYTIELDPAYVDVIVDRFKNAYPDETVEHLPGAALG
jgi:DNA modification methylase